MKVVETSSDRMSYTLSEILSQPDCWSECLRQLAASQELRSACKLANAAAEWLLIGCGSSYYLGLTAASTFQHFGLRARAVAASEILLYPELHLLNDRDHIAVLISRSGLTSEVLDTARMLEKERGLRTIVITCADGQPLESLATVTLKMSPADEKSMVMTRSFTAMLLALQYLAAPVSGNSNSCEALFRLAQQVSPLLQKYPPRLREFVESHRYADYIVDGHLLLPADTACHLISSRYCSQTRILRSPIKDYFVSDHAAGDRTSGRTRR